MMWELIYFKIEAELMTKYYDRPRSDIINLRMYIDDLIYSSSCMVK
jgi:hypothetical protein